MNAIVDLCSVETPVPVNYHFTDRLKYKFLAVDSFWSLMIICNMQHVCVLLQIPSTSILNALNLQTAWELNDSGAFEVLIFLCYFAKNDGDAGD